MEILLLVFFIGAVGLAFYAFSPKKSEKQPEVLTGIIPSSEGAFNQESFTLVPEEQVNNNSLNTELEELKIRHQQTESELQAANQIISDLKDETSRLREKETIEEQLKADIVRLKEELSERIKSFESMSGEYEKKITAQQELLSKEKNKCEDCVSKKELDEVKKKLENAEQVLRMVHGTNC